VKEIEEEGGRKEEEVGERMKFEVVGLNFRRTRIRGRLILDIQHQEMSGFQLGWTDYEVGRRFVQWSFQENRCLGS